MGKAKNDAIIPVAPSQEEMSVGYPDFIANIKGEIRRQRMCTVLSANADMICLYWRIGKAVSER